MIAGCAAPPSVAASSSESPPATWAAAISPWEWPTTAAGSTPQARQSPARADHHREERRLDDLDALDRGGALGAVRGRRAATSRRGGRAPPRSRAMLRGEDRRGLEQLRRHARPLGALAGEEEDGLAPRRAALPGRPPGRPRRVAQRRRGRRAAPRARCRATTARCSKAAAVRWPASRRRRRGSSSGSLAQVGGEAAGLLAQRGLGSWPRARAGSGAAARRSVGRRPCPRRLGLVLGGAGASSRIRWALVPLMPKEETPARRGRAVRLPRLGLGQQLDLARRPSRPSRRARRRAGSSAARPARIAITILITPADPGRRLGVADVRLERAEPQRPSRGPGRRWRAGRRPRSGRRGWCRCRGPRPRRRPRRLQAGVGQRLADHPLLRGAVGGGEAVGGAVLVDRRAADHGEDRVAVALRVGEPLEHEHADALGQAGAVGGLGERLAAPVAGRGRAGG